MCVGFGKSVPLEVTWEMRSASAVLRMIPPGETVRKVSVPRRVNGACLSRSGQVAVTNCRQESTLDAGRTWLRKRRTVLPSSIDVREL